MKNILTIDLEDWYHTLDFNFPIKSWVNFEDRVEYGLSIILEILEKYNTKATFFSLGYIAKKNPKIIKKIDAMGHEIGSHGTWHKLIYKQNIKEFREDIVSSKKILEDIIGKEVNFFRASSWSISKNTLWALDVLQEEGFICDSSIQPFKTPLSGMYNAPTEPFYPIINGEKFNILEFPPTVSKIGNVLVPFAGGLYFRVMPYVFIERALKIINLSKPAMIYLHPWEFDVNQPKLNVKPHIKFTHYYNINNNALKLEKLIKNFQFGTLGEIIKDNNYRAIKIKENY